MIFATPDLPAGGVGGQTPPCGPLEFDSRQVLPYTIGCSGQGAEGLHKIDSANALPEQFRRNPSIGLPQA